MGNYHIEITPVSSDLFMIVIPWGKYEYLKLSTGLFNSPNIIQENMSKMFNNIKEIHAYIDNLLLIANRNWRKHLEKLDKVFNRLKQVG
eukprot:15365400-Ditylum_brightwellii.AAC.3